MERVDDKWLDEALNGAIHSDDTQPDFERWKAQYPEAVADLTTQTPQQQRPSARQTIRMNSLFVKLAAAAVIVIAGIVGVTQLIEDDSYRFAAVRPATTLTGPMTHALKDGSVVTLAANASIRIYDNAVARGFEHLAGAIEVTVTKGKGEFIVTCPHGAVKALGTQFTMDLVDGVTVDTRRPVNLLAVEVTEGKVEVSNDKGKTTLGASQDIVVDVNSAPYDFNQDEALPDRLKERIQAMVAAFEAGDAAAWAANYNYDYLFKLAKGKLAYDPLRFGGSEADAQRLGTMLADIESPEEMGQAFIAGVNITEPVTVYVRSVKLSTDGAHAKAECVARKSERHMTITRPQWHDFDNDWWQVDD